MQILSLNGSWHAAQAGADGALTHKVTGTVPGCIHMDLSASGKIPDPYYRDNELALQWIGEVDWTYSRTFTVPASLLTHERVLLRCEGLDTFATIRINDTEVARTNNMFRTWEFDVKTLLHLAQHRASRVRHRPANRRGHPAGSHCSRSRNVNGSTRTRSVGRRPAAGAYQRDL
jgi:beta-mannosidase